MEIQRFRRACQRHGSRLLERIFTPLELSTAGTRRDPYPHLAARFAAKEACAKALGVPKGWGWHDIEVRRLPDGSPKISLSGGVSALLRRKAEVVDVSVSHSEHCAMAVVLAKRVDRHRPGGRR